MSEDAEPWPDELSSEAGPRKRPGSRKKRRKQRVNPESLERWAVHHLGRYSSTASNLRRVLLRRVGRIEREQEENFPEASDWIDATVADLVKRGYLDDRKYARALVSAMRERGNSARKIESQLGAKGVSWAIAREVVDDVSGSGGEMMAALRYAKRRRLGPFRLDDEVRKDRRERDLAALGRSGFSYDIASRIIDAKDPETIETSLFEQD